MRIPFRRKQSRYEKARDTLHGMVKRARERLQQHDDDEPDDAPPQRPRIYRERPVLRIIIKD